MNVLQLMKNGQVVRLIPMSEGALHLGRGAANDVVLTDDQVSKNHAVFVQEGSDLRVEDLKSTNGTFVNGDRIDGSVSLSAGDVVRLGTDVELRIQGLGPSERAVPPTVRDVDAGVRYSFQSDRFRIGSADRCELRIPDAPDLAATLLLMPDGSVQLGDENGEVHDLPLDEPFEVAGAKLVLERGDSTTAPTAKPEDARYHYALTASLNGPGGPQARIEDLTGSAVHTISAGNRAILLYLLVRQRLSDQGKPSDQQGWTDDEDVATGIWGKNANKLASSSYYVLVHRLRKELQKNGFDPWFIEKRQGAIRIRLDDVSLGE